MRYRRSDVGGGTYFFTVNLAERKRTLLVDHMAVLRTVMRDVSSRYPFRADALVVLPDHLHVIWTLPEGDHDFATRWMLIKVGFSRRIAVGERRNRSRTAKGERGIWQRRYWEHLIRDEQDFARHADYIHFNPVKHGHVTRAVDWSHSTFHRYVEAGIYPRDWGGDVEDGQFGERR